MTPPRRRVRWRPTWRLVASRFPPVALFDRVADPADLEAVLAVEGLTDARRRDEAGELSLVALADRISGPGTTPIMAAFTHLNPAGSRFTNGEYGVYYAGHTLETAIAETSYHRARFLAATAQPPIEIDMRSYAADVDARLHDLRGLREALPAVYDPLEYGAGQRLGAELRASGSNGVVYESVRDPGGECLGVFRPRVLSPARQGPHYCYVWDGRAIIEVYRKESVR